MRRALLAVLIAAQGCASYNSNYKANKYADEARRLDSEGRTLEAGGYWGRAAVKAESLLVRNPNSKYAPGAMAIRGEASAALGQCGQASKVLPTAIERLKNTTDREQATIALAGCAKLGSPALAASTVQPVTESRDATRRRQALLLLGTAERQSGRNAEALVALTDLQGSPALVQRTLAYGGAHDSAAATAAFDSLLALRDSTLPWDSLLTITGRADPVLASSLTSTLVASRIVSADRAAALSFADAARLAEVDTVMQRARYEEIIRVYDGTGGYADRARFDMTRMRIRAADSMADLASTLEAMQEIAAADGSVEGALVPLRRQVEVLQRLMDSTAPGAPQGDMRRFLAAEYARDTLDARPLAARIFESIPQGWPESPYAAKAWLAGRQLTGDTADVSGQFASSPYMAVLRGEEGATYAQPEDSLANYARALADGSAPKPVRRGAAKRADGTIDPVEEDAPGAERRRQQRARSTTPAGRTPAGAGSTVPAE